VAEPVHLNRRRTERHDRRARHFHIAIEIDQDIDAQVADAPSGLYGGDAPQVVIEVHALAMARVVSGIAPAPSLGHEGVDFETRTIVGGEKSQRDMAHRMVAQVGRHVPDPEAAFCG
jgi:hypothetical protein